MMRPRPEWIESFLAVVDEPTYEAAAHRLGISQPTVWKHVRQLSRAVGIDLFHPGGSTLTAGGEALVPLAKRLLGGCEAFEELSSAIRAGSSGTIRLACYPAHVRHALARALGELKREVPDVTLKFAALEEVRAPGREPALDLLRSGQVDVAVGPRSPENEAERLYDAHLVAVVPKGGRLANSDGIQLPDLAGTPLLVAPDGHSSRLELESLMSETAVDLLVAGESSHWGALLALTEAGLGVTVMYSDGLRSTDVIGCSTVRILDSTNSPRVREAWLQWRRNEDPQPIV